MRERCRGSGPTYGATWGVQRWQERICASLISERVRYTTHHIVGAGYETEKALLVRSSLLVLSTS